MCGEEKMEKFTKELCELLVDKNISLLDSLKIMKERSKRKTKKTASYVINQLEQGELLSNALQKCTIIHFDTVYVTFIAMAEKSENLRSTIDYLNQRAKRTRENKSKLIGALIYPLFVIFLTLGICIFLRVFLNLDNGYELYGYFSFFLCICGVLLYVIWKILGLNKMYEAFLGTDLLVKNGISISTAISYGALIAGPDSKVGKAFILAAEKMEYGMDLRNAFSLKDELQEVFYYADVSGGKKDIFERMATWIAQKDEKRRFICLQLIEPIFIAITGFFLLVVILNFFVPMINNYSFV